MDDFELGLEFDGSDRPSLGNREVNELMDYWADRIGYPLVPKAKNRRFVWHLLSHYNVEQIKQLVDAVAMSQTDQFAPRIGDFVQLFYKLNQLLAWIKRQGSGTETIEVD